MTDNNQSNTNQIKPVIAVFGSYLHNEKEFSVISTLEETCRNKDYYIVAFSFADDNSKQDSDREIELTLVNLIKDINLKGIVIMRESLTSEMIAGAILKIAKERNIPVYSLDKPTEGCSNVVFDYGESFKKIVRHLVEDHGCRDIAMMAGMKDNEFSEERINACREVLEEHGLELKENRLFYGEFWEKPTRAATKQLLESGDIPDAVCCANDAMAVAVCDVLKEAGYSVPEDILVTGFDGIESGQYHNPPISTMIPDYKKEIETILAMMEDDSCVKESQSRTTVLQYVLDTNCSCGCTIHVDDNRDDELSQLSYKYADVKSVHYIMNRVIAEAPNVNSLEHFSDYIDFYMGAWIRNLYNVAVFAELMGEKPGEPAGNTYRTLYRKESGERVIINDTYSENVFLPRLNEIMNNKDLDNLLIVRLLYTGNVAYGYTVEGFKNYNSRDFQRGEEYGIFLSTAISVALANIKLNLMNSRLKEANNQIETISVTDYLTGIYNRRGFMAKIDESVNDKDNHGKYLSIFSIDMDGLKSVNDVYGHEEGDFAIKTVANAIKSFSARNGFCSRYGGDEFACVIISHKPFELSANEVRERLRMVICNSSEAMSKPYPITVSVGSDGHIIEDDANEMKKIIEDMVKVADEKMYHDKQNKKQHISDAMMQ